MQPDDSTHEKGVLVPKIEGTMSISLEANLYDCFDAKIHRDRGAKGRPSKLNP